MSTNTGAATALRDEFAALLDESFGGGDAIEGTVVKGTIVGVENDVVVIDVGLKAEGRVPVSEFGPVGSRQSLLIGDTVEVFLERMEDKNGEAMLSARRGHHLRPRQGRLHRGSRRRRGVPAGQPGRHPSGP